MTPLELYIIIGALIIGTPIAIAFSDREVEKEAKRRAEKYSYEYDPKNWDTLNR